jgi:CRISPR-associated protein Csx10
MRITITATLQQDVSPSSGREIGYRGKIEPYIPGSALRGALASGWIRTNGIPLSSNARQGEFVEMFERNVRFGYLFAPNQQIIPLSVLQCKYRSRIECRQVFFDEALGQNATSCPICSGPVETSKGTATIDTRAYRTRTELTQDERAEDGRLFARHVIPKGEGWTGEIVSTGSDGAQQNLHAQLDALSDELVVIGGSRTTLGRTKIAVAVRKVVTPQRREDGKLLVRLTAPGIFLDRFGRPAFDLPLDEVAGQLGVSASSLAIDRAWVRPMTVGGWHAASGLPKPTDWACAPGSTWLVSGLGSDTDLKPLNEAALGFRRNEGNGAIALNPIFAMSPDGVMVPTPTGVKPNVSLDQFAKMDDREIRWLLGELKQARVHLETTGSIRKSTLPERVRDYSDEQLRAVTELLGTPAVDSINQSIAILNGLLP